MQQRGRRRAGGGAPQLSCRPRHDFRQVVSIDPVFDSGRKHGAEEDLLSHNSVLVPHRRAGASKPDLVRYILQAHLLQLAACPRPRISLAGQAVSPQVRDLTAC